MKPGEVVLSLILALGLLAAPVLSDGQQPGKVYRIGWLSNAPPAATDTNPQRCPITGTPNWQAFVEGLRERGYVPGQNLVIECRWTEGRAERAPALAAELVGLKPDLIVVFSTANVRAAKQATSTMPIVMTGVIDPERRGRWQLQQTGTRNQVPAPVAMLAAVCPVSRTERICNRHVLPGAFAIT